MMADGLNTGVGQLSPLDAEQSITVRITVADGVITGADYECTEDEYLIACARAICAVITDKPAADLFQMNANAVYYNIDTDLPRDRLYCASMAVTAAKRAASDWCCKNGVEVPHTGGCSCY